MHGITYCASCTSEVVIQVDAFSRANTDTIDFGVNTEADLNWLAWVFDLDRNNIQACVQAGFPVPAQPKDMSFCGECLRWFV